MNAIQIWRRIDAALAWPGLLGLALLLLALGVYFAQVQPQTARLAALKQDSASLKTRIDQAAKSGIPESGNQDELGKFYGYFSDAALSDWLNKLYAAAAAHKLLLEQGEYRITPSKNGKLARYQITLPVKGSYVQIRQFVAQALNDVPVAALEDISFKREAIGATDVETRIKFTLFLGVDRVGKN
jgi:Tfp pilus assembly protein PilO